MLRNPDLVQQSTSKSTKHVSQRSFDPTEAKTDEGGFFLTGLNLQSNKAKIQDVVVLADSEPVDEEANAIEKYKLVAVIDAPRSISKTDVSVDQSLSVQCIFLRTRKQEICHLSVNTMASF
jgi:hypothetical protein